MNVKYYRAAGGGVKIFFPIDGGLYHILYLTHPLEWLIGNKISKSEEYLAWEDLDEIKNKKYEIFHGIFVLLEKELK
jgi:hypothetical protein